MVDVEVNPWGRRYLMCPPVHFEVAYAINPWMARDTPVDADLAATQWEALISLLADAGAEVEVLPPEEGLPDLVFTANAGLVDGDRFFPARFRYPERQGETAHNAAWFADRGWRVEDLPPDTTHEGAGDALPFGDTLVGGHRWRTDATAHEVVAQRTGAPLCLVELTDERYFHLDLTFCPLDARRALVAPHVWDEAGRRAVEALVPEPLVLTPEEADAFTANSVVVGRNVVMTACPPRVGRQLEAWGFEVAVADVGEFEKSGGGVRCLTLALDVTLSPARAYDTAPTVPPA
ncbi:MAG TPA: arginine deiminase-related protein [Acidimicrobiales bacterium]|nr:arginine deiminase-related protein [Acidimicrobiales bacterium]